MDLKKSGRSLLQVAFSSLLMGLAAYVICSSGDWSLSGHTGEKMLLLGSGIGAGILIYIGSSYGMKNQELLFLMRMLRRKR
jgi:hypothetical protein